MNFLDRILSVLSLRKETVYHPLNKEIREAYNATRPEGPQKHFCYVPSTGLTFSFRGQVYACSYNRQVLLGSYPENTIEEIWHGKEAKKLRSHLANNDLNYGCGHCKYFADRKKFSNLKPLNFDKYAKELKKDYPLVMEFELSNTCNLECQMCIGEVSSSIRHNRDKLPPIPNPYDDKFLKQLEEYIPHLKEAKFYGGEPFLIKNYFKIWDLIYKLNPDLKMFVITNGTVWNKRIEEVLYRAKFDVAISIDSLNKELLEKIRKNVEKDRLLQNIQRIKKYADDCGTSISLSFTLQKENWQELPAIIEYCNSLEAHIFVSYLETPTEFAITSFAKEYLIMMKETMEMITFPSTKKFEEHNANCFKDFIQFLNYNIENTNNSNYVEYRYGGKSEEHMQQLEKNINNYFQHKDDGAKNKNIFYDKLLEIENKIKDPIQIEQYYTIISNAPINIVVSQILERSVEQSYLDLKKLLTQ